MIQVNKCMVEMEGSLTVLNAEMVLHLRSFREILTDELGEEFADFVFAEAGRLACAERADIDSGRHLEGTIERAKEALEIK